MQRVLPQLAITLPPEGDAVDPADWFERPVEAMWLEIGFGKGEHLAWQLRHNPDIGFIGCEPYETGIASLIAELDERGRERVRVYADDAGLLLAQLAPASLARVFLLFPDPWPKTRHHKRRFIGKPSLDLLARVMAPGAELRIATDHMGYLTWILKHMVARQDFAWMAERPADWRARPDDWPATRYEVKALEDGARPAYLRYRRRGR